MSRLALLRINSTPLNTSGSIQTDIRVKVYVLDDLPVVHQNGKSYYIKDHVGRVHVVDEFYLEFGTWKSFVFFVDPYGRTGDEEECRFSIRYCNDEWNEEGENKLKEEFIGEVKSMGFSLGEDGRTVYGKDIAKITETLLGKGWINDNYSF